MKIDLEGKVCVITGVSKGIGLALSQHLLKLNVQVVGLGRTSPELEGDNFTFIETNVRSNDSVVSAFEKVNAKFDRVDFLINNAGLGYFGYLEDLTLEQWHQMFETNVNGIFYTSKCVIPGMKKNGSGHIINISSIAGLEAYPQVSGYSGSKFAVRGISEAMYKELRDFGVKVTCVYPGSVKTDFFVNSSIETHDYMLKAEDVADMIVYSLGTPFNFHQVNLEVRPLQPRGPKK